MNSYCRFFAPCLLFAMMLVLPAEKSVYAQGTVVPKGTAPCVLFSRSYNA